MRLLIAPLVAAAVLPWTVLDGKLPADPIPAALLKMADTERAFAKRAQETTIRDAFIEYFAVESIGFEPDPVPARESLRKQTRPQTPGVQLLWEPRLGDVAASGDLGYLTGPSETIIPGKPTRYGNYFSVWKRQADGEFRVILDVGGMTPEKAAFEPGFTRALPIASWKGREPRVRAEASLLAADRSFSSAIAQQGFAAAYGAAMHEDARFVRSGFRPMITKQAAIGWMNANITSVSTEPMKSETGASGDLGYTWGKYSVTLTSGNTANSYYVRVWTRKADGSWQVVSDVISPPPPPPASAGH